MELGNYFEAVADSGRCIKLQADSIEALEVRGIAYYKLHEHEMALNHWRQVSTFFLFYLSICVTRVTTGSEISSGQRLKITACESIFERKYQ